MITSFLSFTGTRVFFVLFWFVFFFLPFSPLAAIEFLNGREISSRQTDQPSIHT